MGVALDVDGVVVGVDVARAVADGVQAGDRLAVGVQGFEVVGDVDAAADAEQARADLAGIEGAFLDGVEEMRLLVEVGILAHLAHRVVALDAFQGHVGRHVELGDELLDGLAHLVVVGVALDAALDGFGMRRRGLGRVGSVGTEAVPEHAAAILEAVGVVGLEVGVENRPGVVVAAVDHDAHALALHPGRLVHKALAFGVKEQERPVVHGGGLRVHHRRPWRVLERGAGPGGHVVAVAGVAQVAAQTHQNLVGNGRIGLDVLVVVAHVACCQYHALARVVLHVLAVGVLADGTGHRARLVLDELHRGHLEHELGAGRFGLLHEQVLDAVGHGVLLEDGAAVEHVVAVGLGMHGRVGTHRHHDAHLMLLGHVEQPVHAALGLAEPLAHERLAAAATAGGDPALHLDGLVDGDAQLVHRPRAHGTVPRPRRRTPQPLVNRAAGSPEPNDPLHPNDLLRTLTKRRPHLR